ncbi:MAG: AF1514 family protein [Desulfamplus sp.]|nr:AF1514 family protein [Desulfamplus sp.]
MQIFSENQDRSIEYIHHTVAEENLDLRQAKEIAKKLASQKCSQSMILSWKNGITGEFYPTFECGGEQKPAWIHYAEARGANLTIDINDGQYIFMILKL